MTLSKSVCGGTIARGGRVERSILSPYVRVNSYAQESDGVIMDGVDIGRSARVSRAIVDKNVRIPPGCVIGEDREKDERRFTVTPEGVVVIPRNTLIE